LSYKGSLPKAARKAVSVAALEQLSRNGIGVGTPGVAVDVRAPRTVEEVAEVPAVLAILGLLDREARVRGEKVSTSSATLHSVRCTMQGSRERALFMDEAGLTIISWIRHVEAHVFFVTDELPLAGLSSAVVKEVLQVALEVIVRDYSALGFSLDGKGVLTRSPPVAGKERRA